MLWKQKKTKVRKRSLTLIEVTIGLSLTGLLLGVLFFAYRYQTMTHAKLETTKEEVISHQRIQQRFIKLFSAVPPFSEEKEKDAPCIFYTTSAADATSSVLSIVYDNGLDPEPAFSALVRSELFVNKKQQLILRTYSLRSEKTSPREELLLEHCKQLQFNFFDPEDPKKEVSLWDEKRKKVPFLVDLSLTSSTKKKKVTKEKKAAPEALKFSFFVPSSYVDLTYKKQ